jgi:hypothetical protein
MVGDHSDRSGTVISPCIRQRFAFMGIALLSFDDDAVNELIKPIKQDSIE